MGSELERLVVRLVGEDSGYTQMLDKAADATKTHTKVIENESKRAAAAQATAATTANQAVKAHTKVVETESKRAAAATTGAVATVGQQYTKATRAVVHHAKAVEAATATAARAVGQYGARVTTAATTANQAVKAHTKVVEQETKRAAGATATAASQTSASYNAAGRAIDQHGRFVSTAAQTAARGAKHYSDEANRATNATARLTDRMGTLSSRLDAVGNQLQFVGRRAAVALTLPIAAAGGAMLKFAGDVEQTKMQLEVMLRSADKGNALFEELTRFAAATPFQFKGVSGAAKVLLAFGLQQEELGGTLRMLGDVAAGTGKDFQELAVIYGQIRGLGRLQGQDYLQLVNAMFPVGEIAKTMGVEMGELKDLMEAGNVPFEVVEETFRRITKEGGVFNNMMGRLSGTFLGLLSTARDEVTILAAALGKLLMPYALQLLAWVRQAVVWFGQLNPYLQMAALGIAALTAAVGPLVLGLGLLVSMLAPLVPLVEAFTMAAAVGVATSVAWYAGIVAIVGALAALVVELVGAEVVVGLFGGAWGYATDKATAFATFTIGFLANFRKNMGALIPWLGSNWEAVFTDMGGMAIAWGKNLVVNTGTAIRTLFRLFTAFAGWLRGIFMQVFSLDFTRAVTEGVKKVGKLFLDFAHNAWKAISSIFTGKKVTMDDFLGQMDQDFNAGQNASNFLQTAADIMQEEAGNFVSPLAGFESAIQEGPELALEWGTRTAEALNQGLATAGDGAAQAVEPMKVLSKEAAKLQEDITATVQSLQQQIATFGMSARAVEIWSLQTKGADATQVALMNSLDKQLTALEKQKAAMEQGKQLTKQYRSPLEVFKDRQEELTALLDQGAINAGTFTSAMADAEKQLNKEYTAKLGIEGVDAVEAGSAEALARLQAYAANKVTAKAGIAALAAAGGLPGGVKAPGTSTPQAVQVTATSQGDQHKHESRVEGLLATIAELLGKEGDVTSVTLSLAGL